MKKRKILSVLLVALMLLTQLGMLGTGVFAAEGAPSGYDFDIVLINGAKVGTDDLEEAFEILYAFKGGKLTLNADAELDGDYAGLYYDTVIDLNGHTIDGLYGGVNEEIEVIITDSSADKGGKLGDGILLLALAESGIDHSGIQHLTCAVGTLRNVQSTVDTEHTGRAF